MKRTPIFSLTILGLLLSVLSFSQQAGTLDSSFGSNGVVTLGLSHKVFNPVYNPYRIKDYVQFNNGDIIAIGDQNKNNTLTFESLILSRHKSNGKVDSSFGQYGIVNFRKQFTHPLFELGKGLLSEQTGNLYVLFKYLNGSTGVANFDLNGKTDSTFGNNGYQTLDSLLKRLFITYNISQEATLLQSNGSLLFSGTGVLGSKADSSVGFSFRLKGNGNADSTYGINGLNILFTNRFSAQLKGVNKWGQDSLVHMFSGGNSNDFNKYIYIVRSAINSGARNTQLGINGMFQSDIFSLTTDLNFITQPQSDGSFIVTRFLPSSVYSTRYLSNGVKANNFGAGSFDYSFFAANRIKNLSNHVQLETGGFMVLFESNYVDSILYNIARLLPNGTIDTTFGIKGLSGHKPTIAGTSPTQYSSPISLKTGETNTTFWTVRIPASNLQFARFKSVGNNLQDELSFGDNGLLSYIYPMSNDYPLGIGQLANGKYLIATTTDQIVSDSTIYLCRFNADGNPDLTYGQNGKIAFRLPFEDRLNGRNKLIITRDNKVLINFINYNARQILIYCFDANGNIVSTYGTNGVAKIQMNSDIDWVNHILEQPDKKVVLSVDLINGVGICRFKEDGKVDSLFGNSGFFLVPGSGIDISNSPGSILYTKDNKLVLPIGSHDNDGGKIRRMNYWGKVDSTFYVNGSLELGNGIGQSALGIYEFGAGSYSYFHNGISIPGDGSNYAYLTSLAAPFLIGSPDSSFYRKLTYPSWINTNSGDFVSAIATHKQNDGKYIIAFMSKTSGNTNVPPTFFLHRANYRGIPDSSFGVNSYLKLDRLPPSADPINPTTKFMMIPTQDNQLMVAMIGSDEFLEDVLLYKVRLNDIAASPMIYMQPPPPTTPSPANTTYCAGSTIPVSFNLSGNFATSNTFTVQLSNATGGFSAPTNIGSLSGTSSGVINGTIPAGTPAGTGYRMRIVSSNPVVISTDNGSNISITASNLAITSQPSSQTVCSGSTASFSVIATGSGAISYQWKKDGSVITGATSSFYTIASTSPSAAGSYTVDVIGTCGTMTSAAATLIVNTGGSCTTALNNLDTDVSTIMLLPSVVENNSTLRVNVRRPMVIVWALCDATGRMIERFNQRTVTGSNDLNLQLVSLSKGVYQLFGKTSNGKRVLIKFIKI